MYNDKFILCSRFAISSSSSLSPVANVRTIRSVSVCVSASVCFTSFLSLSLLVFALASLLSYVCVRLALDGFTKNTVNDRVRPYIRFSILFSPTVLLLLFEGFDSLSGLPYWSQFICDVGLTFKQWLGSFAILWHNFSHNSHIKTR